MGELKNITKAFDGEPVLQNVNLDIYDNELSPCWAPRAAERPPCSGSSAALRPLMRAMSSFWARKSTTCPPTNGTSTLFSKVCPLPHLNVFENVAFPLRVRKVPKAEMIERVKMALKHTSLDGMEKVYPGNLSGGQQQRIALARAIVTNPKVMLLDEPLSNLDPKLRETMRFEIKELQKKFNFTIIFVTHDQSEAMALSDRMMVMDMGNIVQIGTPTELYNRPVNRFVHNSSANPPSPTL